MNDELATRVRTARFTAVRLKEAYDMGQVDWLLDQLEAALLAGRPVDQLVAEARFSPVRMREGYEMREVDRFLEEIVRDAHAAAQSSPTEGFTPAPEQPTLVRPDPASTAARDDDGLADEIDAARFTTVRLQKGYDMGEVDEFLEALAERVRSGLPVADVVEQARFTPVSIREGYAISEVDDFLDHVVAAAAESPAEGSRGPMPTTTEAQPPAASMAPPEPAPAAPTPNAPIPPPAPSAVQEVQSPLRRLFHRRR